MDGVADAPAPKGEAISLVVKDAGGSEVQVGVC
jgi:hypothetical protein